MSTIVHNPDEGIGAVVRRRRGELGLNQQDLADLAQVSRKFVYSLEDGKPSVQLDKVEAVLGVLGLHLIAARISR